MAKNPPNQSPASEPETEEASDGGLVRKLSPKTIIGAIPVPKPGKPLALFNIYGVARGVREGETSFGHWRALVGNFEAVRLSDGVLFSSPQAFLPEPALSMVADAVIAGGENAEVRFALQIGVKHIKKRDNTDGYEYTTQTAIKPEQAKQLEELRESLKALPGPKA